MPSNSGERKVIIKSYPQAVIWHYAKRLNDQLSFSFRHIFFIMFIRFFYSHLILILTHFVFFPGGRGLGQGVLTTDTELWKHGRIRRILQCSADKHTVLWKRILHGNMKRWTDSLTNLYLNTLFSSSVSAEYNIWLSYLSFTNHTVDWFSQAEFALPFHLCFVLISSACFLFYSFSAWTFLLNVDSSGEHLRVRVRNSKQYITFYLTLSHHCYLYQSFTFLNTEHSLKPILNILNKLMYRIFIHIHLKPLCENKMQTQFMYELNQSTSLFILCPLPAGQQQQISFCSQ